MSAIFILNRFLKESIIILLFFRFFLISHDASSPRTILFLVYNIAPQCSTFILSFPPQMGYNVHVSKEPCRNAREQNSCLQVILVSCISIGRMPVSERLLSRARMALCGDLSFTKPPGTLHKQQSNNQVNIYESKNTE